VPVIYVMGGRTDAYTPTDLVQKYYPWGYGTEDLTPWSQDFAFQTTGNQVDIWSPYFLRPDTDQFPGSNVNFDPEVEARREDGGSDGVLPTLPTPLYGLMAVKMETEVEGLAPTYPNGPFKQILIFGGITPSGDVSAEVRLWNPDTPADNTQSEEQAGVLPWIPSMCLHSTMSGIPMVVIGRHSREHYRMRLKLAQAVTTPVVARTGSWLCQVGLAKSSLISCTQRGWIVMETT